VHELGITQGIVDRAREAAAENAATRVTDVYVVMTPAADFTEESVLMYFGMLTQDDDLLRGARVCVEHLPASAECLDCGRSFSVDAPEPSCVRCGSANVRFDPAAPMIQLTGIRVDEP